MPKNLTKRSEDYSKWYNELVVKADLAENSSVRGCMVIKPYGYAIWEKIQKELDNKFKETGHYNAYFPLFVPKSLFEAEEKNAEGFAKECAVVTHYRLKNDENNPGKLKVDENSKLDEELIVRPTSEAVIWNTYKKWIQSYRDLPILLNQWANVVRWEMRTRLFLRTSEFLWQEGHTAHATKNEAIAEAKLINKLYADFVNDFMAISVVSGTKSESERFAGAEETYCIEALMQDGKALQAGTSHFLGQNFAKAFDVKFSDKDGKLEHVWATSWGVSTRLMGALIMTHGDDNGLVLPPKLAPNQIVFIPIFKSENELNNVLTYIEPYVEKIRGIGYSIKVDDRLNFKPGYKYNEHELKGVPIRVTVGSRDIENKSLIDFQNKTKFVLATGGGIITNEGSRNFLSKERTYFLDGSEEILYERSTRRREFRPLMKDMDIKGFSQLLKKRRQYYIESSIATIDIDKKNIDEVVDWIKNNEKNHF